MTTIGFPTASAPYSRYLRSAEAAPNVPTDPQGRPAPSVRLRHVASGETVTLYPIDARAALASGEYEAEP